MALRGRMKLASYDRLFPSQDMLPAGGVGNLIAAPLFKPARDEGRTVFADPGTLEPYRDQWAFLPALGRMSPREADRAADKAGRVLTGSQVKGLAPATASDPATGRAGHRRCRRSWCRWIRSCRTGRCLSWPGTSTSRSA